MVDKIGYESTVKQLELLQKEGPLGVKCDEKFSFVKRPWLEKISLMATLIFSRLSPEQTKELTKLSSLAGLKVQALNSAHQEIKPDSSYFKSYFSAAKTINLWNSIQGGLQHWLLKRAGLEFSRPKIDYTGHVATQYPISSSHLLTFAYNSQDKIPLIVTANGSEAILSKHFPKKDIQIFQNLLRTHHVLLLRGIKQDETLKPSLQAIFGEDIVVQVSKDEIKVVEKSYHDAQAKLLEEQDAKKKQQLLTLMVMDHNMKLMNHNRQLMNINRGAYGR